MKLCVLGSGSGGNSIYIDSNGAGIIIDQGFSFKSLAERMNSRGLDVSRITAILVSHEHGDHISGVGITARKLSIPVYATGGTLESGRSLFRGGETLNRVTGGVSVRIGPFEILPFSVSHDAAEPVQYVICTRKKRIAVATDLGFVSHLVHECLKTANLVVLEANHDVEMLRNGSYTWPLKQRIMSRTGHLSNRNAAEILFNLSNAGRGPDIVLAHLSEENNRPELAEREVRELFERHDKKIKSLVIAAQNEATPVITI